MSTRTTLHETTDNTGYAYDINLSRNIPCAKLGFKVHSNLGWDCQITHVTRKASRRLHFLRLLAKGGMPPEDLVTVYRILLRREEAARTLLTQMRASHPLHYMVTSDRREETKKDVITTFHCVMPK
ncbi:N-acetylated-alpha-linked acidic dipeptidase 2 [Branchiostoma belcheri]|nr:N-acetylated-alpha-linked acidic dipeptidase 2 [Branchiostoma belcheri]